MTRPHDLRTLIMALILNNLRIISWPNRKPLPQKSNCLRCHQNVLANRFERQQLLHLQKIRQLLVTDMKYHH